MKIGCKNMITQKKENPAMCWLFPLPPNVYIDTLDV